MSEMILRNPLDPLEQIFKQCAQWLLASVGSDIATLPDGSRIRFGVPEAALAEGVTIGDLTESQAIDHLRRLYWDPLRLSELPYPLNLLLFDEAFTSTPETAAAMLNEEIGLDPAKRTIDAQSIRRATAINQNGKSLELIMALLNARTRAIAAQMCAEAVEAVKDIYDAANTMGLSDHKICEAWLPNHLILAAWLERHNNICALVLDLNA